MGSLNAELFPSKATVFLKFIHYFLIVCVCMHIYILDACGGVSFSVDSLHHQHYYYCCCCCCETGAHQFGQTKWQPAPVATGLHLLRASRGVLGFSVGAGDVKSGSHACMANTYPPSFPSLLWLVFLTFSGLCCGNCWLCHY